MKKVTLLTIAALSMGAVVAQTKSHESMNHGATVRTVAKSETIFGENKGEDVSSVASVKSRSTVSAANTHRVNNDKKETEVKERPSSRVRATGDLESSGKVTTGSLDGRYDQTADLVTAKAKQAAEIQAKAKEKVIANTKAESKGSPEASVRVNSNVKARKHKGNRGEAGLHSGAKVQLRNPGLSGRIGAISRLGL